MDDKLFSFIARKKLKENYEHIPFEDKDIEEISSEEQDPSEEDEAIDLEEELENLINGS